MKWISLTFLFLCTLGLFAQNTQTIRGVVRDADTQQPLIGAEVFIVGDIPMGATTDLDGQYRIPNVQVGRVEVRSSYIGYEDYSSGMISVVSGKEMILDILLEESVMDVQEVVVTAKQSGQTNNEALTISSRNFSIKESNRMAGSINDPGRVVLNYAGVQATQDNDNDVIVRGNSAVGVLWRLEGVDVPNVNHFSRPGSSGGGITALSPHVVQSTDFSTGAFPAEYGNSFSGMFDIKFRKGNKERHEFTVRPGIIGLNFGAEGPMSKNGKNSYLFNYRYSTLGILNKIGIYIVGEDTENTFQDASFNFAFNNKPNRLINVFGLGGLSSEITAAKTDSTLWENYSDKFQTDFITNLGIIGVSWTELLDDKSYLKIVVAGTYNDIVNNDDTIDNNLQLHHLKYSKFTQSKIAFASYYNRKISKRFQFRTGLMADEIFYNFEERKLDELLGQERILLKGDGATTLLQPYFQIKYRPSQKITINAGLHGMYLALNNQFAGEPRLSINYKATDATKLSFAYGLHSQMQPIGSYFTQGDPISSIAFPNKDLKFTRSHHLVGAFEHFFKSSYRFKTEVYYQYLFNVPVSADPNSTLFILNERSGFATEPLVNEGTGTNYGADFTLEKFYSNRWFFMVNGSVFKSTYQPLNGKTYSTHYDNRFGLTGMLGKEFKLKKDRFLETSLRIQYSGGFRYTPIDLEASILAQESVTIDSLAYTETLDPYFRPDLRIAFKNNKKKLSYTISLDLANFVNYQNVLRQFYNRDTNALDEKYQLGLLPIIAFQMDFYKKKKASKVD